MRNVRQDKPNPKCSQLVRYTTWKARQPSGLYTDKSNDKNPSPTAIESPQFFRRLLSLSQAALADFFNCQ
jgi:hypothetical protein